MEFESPDVERDFPGLYASESGKRSDGSDFSDDSHEKVSKKDLLIGKRKDKKDSKKDRGYATLEGESSPEEDPDIKSPSKSKKSKTFKFSTKKEKREKSREKEGKEKDNDKDKDKKKGEEKEKDKKKDKVKLKLKDKKKSKQDDSTDIDDLPIFGVPLSVATERSKCHDGVDIPLVVRHCIDHVQLTGLTAENVYKVAGIKSRVQQVKRLYNQREQVSLVDYDLPIATSLLKLFLRELPEPVFTTELLSRFEEACSMQDVAARGIQLRSLVDQLPSCNRTLLAWLIKHLDSIAAHEKHNKMSVQNIASTIGPVLQTSQRLIAALVCHSSDLFPNTILSKYIPPLTSTSQNMPESCEGISEELKKQESLLEQLHSEINRGLVNKTKEEQLWEVQRIITQLKRKLRSLERTCGGCRSMDDTDNSLRIENQELNLRLQSPEQSPLAEKQNLVDQTNPSVSNSSSNSSNSVKQNPLVNSRQSVKPVEPAKPVEPTKSVEPAKPVEPTRPTEPIRPIEPSPLPRRHDIPPAAFPPLNHFKPMTAESLEVEDINRPAIQLLEKKQLSVLETEELTNVIINLRALCELEMKEINRIKNKILQLGGNPNSCNFQSDDSDDDYSSLGSSNFEKNGIVEKKKDLRRENKKLKMQKEALVRSICVECDACIDLRVQIKLLKMSKSH